MWAASGNGLATQRGGTPERTRSHLHPLGKDAIWVSGSLWKADPNLLHKTLPDRGHAPEASGPDVPAREPDLNLRLPKAQLQHDFLIQRACHLAMRVSAARGVVLQRQATVSHAQNTQRGAFLPIRVLQVLCDVALAL